jgi:hypothetical protein
MTRTITISLAAFVFIAGSWAVRLVCYQPAIGQDPNPLSPLNSTLVSR